MSLVVLWLGLALVCILVYTLFRARWWLYLSLVFLDTVFMAALGLGDLFQVLSASLLVLGFVVLDIFIFKRKRPELR